MIHPHPFLALVLAIVAIAGLHREIAAQDEGSTPRRPNILLAVADDWGWPHAGALGDPAARTPTFDKLASEGVLFRHAYVSSPSCTPSRNAILTGQDFYRLGEGANLHSTLDVAIPTFVQRLEQAGYAVGHFRKAWGPGDFRAGGYDRNPCGPPSTLEAFLADRDPDRPFCFWFGTSDPHRGYKKGSGAAAGIDPATVAVPPFFPDVDAVRGDIADYLFEVERWDRDVGRALAVLEAAGELDHTLVVMTSDHGMPFPRCKGNLYDSGARVPMVIRWPSAQRPGREIDALVSLTDLAPTFLDLAGLEPPPEMTGRSLMPLLRGQEVATRNGVVFGRERHTPAQTLPSLAGYPARALRTERWLLIENLAPDRWPAGVPEGATHPMEVHSDCDNGPTKRTMIDSKQTWPELYASSFGRRPAIELYDCAQDPHQLTNLAAEPAHADVLADLRAQLADYRAATQDPRAGAQAAFDGYPYRAGYIQKRLRGEGK